MSFIDKASNKLSDSINKIIDKSRQCAQLNRLSAVIRNETEVLDRAYIALGKQYYKNLNGDTETPDMSHICEIIEESKARLKKAQAGYDYIKQNGIYEPKPKPAVIKISADEDIQPDTEHQSEDEDITIACSEISVETADETAEEPQTTETPEVKEEPKVTEEPKVAEESKVTEEPKVAEEPKVMEEPKVAEELKVTEEPKVVEEVKTADEEAEAEETDISAVIESIKKKRSYAKKKTVEPTDSEAANDSDAMPIA